jgi:arginyl-tRNA--protein-N-Asp/Glu arginylyltransferase
MILHRDLDIGELSPCPYLPDRKKQIKYFFASELDESDVSFLLAKGWRKFGVYFIYDTRFSHLGLGTFSILKEIEHARSLGLKYYCLGYYVRECQRMACKNNFKPRERYNWLQDKWENTRP